MIKIRVLEKVAMCVTFFAMTVVCVGCSDNKPVADGGGGGPRVSFKGRTCPANVTPEEYAIEVVANPDIFRDPSNNAIVVCEGDKVSWFIQSGTGVIKITFTDPYANDLFGQPNFRSHAGSPKSETARQAVQSQKAHPGRIYKYTIEVQDSGKSFTKDPHVIPM
jgi:hypothetical protein